MMTGLVFVLIGLTILYYPQVLQALFAGLFIFFGLGIIATSWQFRRARRQSSSRFVNWIVRY